MKKIISFIYAFLHLIRIPNLLIIILTQVLLRYGLQKTFLFNGDTAMMSGFRDFLLLVTATVFIAMGGYVINDYFDVEIDTLNKPGKNVVGRQFTGKAVRNLSVILSCIGLISGGLLAYRFRSLTLAAFFISVTGLLWLYSERYKKMLVRGNLIVAGLSALVVLVVWYFEFLHLGRNPENFSQFILTMKDVNLFFMFYAIFAFLCSLIREIIKDMEDIEGDREFGCRTIPIVIGLKKTKMIVLGLTAITILLLGFGQMNFESRGYTLVFWYLLAVVQLPLVFLGYKVFTAKEKEDYQFGSLISKLIMVAGILSIQLLSISL